MKIGVLGFQGGIIEHVYMLKRVFNENCINGEVTIVKRPHDLVNLDGIILPGGESTTIASLAKRMGLLDKLRGAIETGLPVMGVCAGAIMLAKKVIDRSVGEVRQPLLSLMNIEIVRNYYGRQRESFEVDFQIPMLGNKPFRGVFIRAPAIVKVHAPAEPLAKLDDVFVMARQENMLALTFHPELTGDTRIHKLFIDLIKE